MIEFGNFVGKNVVIQLGGSGGWILGHLEDYDYDNEVLGLRLTPKAIHNLNNVPWEGETIPVLYVSFENVDIDASNVVWISEFKKEFTGEELKEMQTDQTIEELGGEVPVIGE